MAVGRTVKRTPEWREMLKRSLIRSGALIGAIALMLGTLFLALALLSYAPSDPSMNTVAGDHVANIMASPGAWAADFLLWLLGVPVALILPLMAVTARRLWGDQDMAGWKGQFGKCLFGIILVGIALALFQTDPLVGLPAGWGGVIGLVTAKGIGSLLVQAPAAAPWIKGGLIVLALIVGLFTCYRSLALEKPIIALRRPALPRLNLPRPRLALAGSPAQAGAGAARHGSRQPGRSVRQQFAAVARFAQPHSCQSGRQDRQGCAGAQRPPARIRARRLPC